jgi:hypothetical protein
MEATERRDETLPAERRTEVDEDGYLYDLDTGEVLDFVGKLPFRPDTRESADWVLSKMADAEGRIVAVNARRRALLANLERQEKEAAARLEWLHRRFDAELAEFTRKDLAGKKAKTLVLDHGRIGFRTSKGTNRITDMPRAVAWMRAEGYAHAVKVVESVNVSDVLNAVTTHAFDEGVEPDTGAFLERSGARETVTIAPGVAEG